MQGSKKTKANAGETLVEVTASIFIFLLLMGILQGAVSYSNAALKKNKEIRADNAAILESLQGADVTEQSLKSVSFAATNSAMTVKGDTVFTIPVILASKSASYTAADGIQKEVTFYLFDVSQDTGTGETQSADQGGDTP